MLEALLGVLRAAGGSLPKDDLFARLQPTHSDRAKSDDTLEAASALGLVTEEASRAKTKVVTVAIPADASIRALASKRLAGGEVSEGVSLFQAFYAWLLVRGSQAPGTGELGKSVTELAELFNYDLDLGSDGAKMNREKARTFPAWAGYAGLGWDSGDLLGFVPDPTAFIDTVLDELASKPKARPATEVVDAINSRCPSVDGGSVYVSIPHAQSGVLSPGLSLALRTLSDRGRLRLIVDADAATAIKLSPAPEHQVESLVTRIEIIPRKTTEVKR
jgi:hypothetical protein